MSKTTRQVRLYPTPVHSCLLMRHCQEYITTVNVLVAAFASGVLEGKVSTKDVTAHLPSAVKNQALRDAQSVLKRSLELGCLPVLKKPICQWNNQNWRIEDGRLILPLCTDGKTQQARIACASVALEGKVGLRRIKKKLVKWIPDIALTSADAPLTKSKAVLRTYPRLKFPSLSH